MLDLQRPRGTRDFGPDEMERRRWVEARMRRVFERLGYREVATPTFENADLFVARSGPQVLAQLYNFTDKGGREMALRPELTAAVMRFYASELRKAPKPLRIYYFGNCFRYENPQMGRYREFWQMGLEYIGRRTPLANAEVIAASVQALKEAGSTNFQVRVGHVSVLRSILSGLGLDTKAEKDLMISIDKKDAEGVIEYLKKRGIDDVERLSDLITRTCPLDRSGEALDRILSENPGMDAAPIEELREVLSLLRSLGSDILLDPSISRGLDYYDGIVFEIDAPSLGAEKQICGGGAYSLSSTFGTDVEGIGFALGFDRVLVSMGDLRVPRSAGPYICISPLGEGMDRDAFGVFVKALGAGVRCQLETIGRPMKKVLTQALASGCTHLILIGEEERSKGGVSLKDLSTHEQRFVSSVELEAVFSSMSLR